ncbi:nitrilase-related carbon-nitrogen hydrolase [Chloroflexota bacterium]
MTGESGGKAYELPTPGGYETVPLAYDEIKVAACQMISEPCDPNDPKPAIQKNLQTMLNLCDEAAAQGCRLMVFPEFSLNMGAMDRVQGKNGTSVEKIDPTKLIFTLRFNREQWLEASILVPGPETKALADKAKEHNCYICFAAYTKEQDWPGHFFNASVIVGPSGDILYNHWKNYWGYPGIGTEYASRVYDVLDEFIERNGWDAVWPVAKTPIGNLAGYICSEGHQPETGRILAFYGCEILCRNFAGGGKGSWGGRFMTEFRGDCAHSICWGVYSNNGTSAPENPEMSWAGGSMVVDPWGNVAAETKGLGNEICVATIPIAEFRTEQNRFDEYHNPHMAAGCFRGGVRTELVVPVYEQFPGQFPPNLLSKYQKEHGGKLPPDCGTTRRYFFENARWKLPYHDPAELS